MREGVPKEQRTGIGYICRITHNIQTFERIRKK